MKQCCEKCYTEVTAGEDVVEVKLQDGSQQLVCQSCISQKKHLVVRKTASKSSSSRSSRNLVTIKKKGLLDFANRDATVRSCIVADNMSSHTMKIPRTQLKEVVPQT